MSTTVKYVHHVTIGLTLLVQTFPLCCKASCLCIFGRQVHGKVQVQMQMQMQVKWVLKDDGGKLIRSRGSYWFGVTLRWTSNPIVSEGENCDYRTASSR